MNLSTLARLQAKKNGLVFAFLAHTTNHPVTFWGLDWQIGKYTDVLRSDGHNVVIFAANTEVLEYVVHSRGYGDFWKLSGKCFPREDVLFVRDPYSKHWLNYVQSRA